MHLLVLASVGISKARIGPCKLKKRVSVLRRSVEITSSCSAKDSPCCAAVVTAVVSDTLSCSAGGHVLHADATAIASLC
jgi:hypothetical protein